MNRKEKSQAFVPCIASFKLKTLTKSPYLP